MAEIAPVGKRNEREYSTTAFACLNGTTGLVRKAMITAAELAEKMKADILGDVASGVVPRSVRSFSELHDFVDANTYGGTEALLDEMTAAAPPTDEGAHQALMDLMEVMNPAIEIVDTWIKSHGVLRGLSAGTWRWQ